MFLLTLLGGGVLGTAVISNADTTTTNAEKPQFMSNIVVAIATKFGLNQAEVQAVFDSEMTKQRTEMEAKMKEAFTTRINTAVAEGKLTQAQADLIFAKKIELEAKLESVRSSGTKPAKEEMEAEITNIKTWAETNNIPKEYLMFKFRMHGGKGFGDKMMKVANTTQ